MAVMTEACRMSEKHKYWKEFESNKHQFFKVLIGNFRDHLRIPRKFVINFRENLSGTVQLRGPSGSMWSVQIESMFGEVFFQNGWEDFVEDHRLGEADMLVFRYIGDSSFSVLIFDPSGCEREGSYFVREHTDDCSNGRCVLEMDDEEDTEEMIEVIEMDDEEDDSQDTIELEKLHFQKRKINKPRGRSGLEAAEGTGKKKPRVVKSAVERPVLIDGSDGVPGCMMEGRWKQSKMKRPVVEKSHMQNKRIKNGTRGSGLKVVDNNGRHQSKNKSQAAERVVLIDESDGDSRCATQASEGESKEPSLASNSLDDGETRRPPGTYYMHYISNRREITKEEKERPRYLSGCHSSKTKRPLFNIIMKASHVCRGFAVRIPKKWEEGHIVGDVRRAVLRVHPGKKTWDVGIRSKPWGKSFNCGWAKFVWDNNLEEHDACVFELDDRGKSKANAAVVVFNVFIHRVLDKIVPLTKFFPSQAHTIS